ncbi:MAG: glycoside hydrolase family 5 protein [Terracidiphilus sp.]
MRFRTLLLAIFFAFALSAFAQDHAADVQTAFARAQHLKHGINASLWFAQHPEDYSANYTNHETTPEDIAIMAGLGFDHVRVSIDTEPLAQAFSGWGDGDFLVRLDKAVDGILATGMAVIVDVHPEDRYKQALRTDSGAVDRMVMLWQKLAAHYAGRDPNLVFFEILNEPEVSDPYRWAGIQARVAAAIRAAAPRQTIIATGPNYSGLGDLLTLHPLADGNVIYNFHFYDPIQFTHQGAGWGSPWWIYTHNIPYPATESAMEDRLKLVPEPADRFQLENYWLDHWDAHHIRLLIDEAAAWGKANNAPLTCNEFGAFREHSDPVSRTNWIRDVRTALEADGIGWAMWDYHNGFGVAVKDPKTGKSIVDPQTVEALGLEKK